MIRREWGITPALLKMVEWVQGNLPCILQHQPRGKIVNKDQVEGRKKEVAGNIKEVAGKIVGNKKMEAKGKVKKALGKAQAGFGDVKADIKNAAR